MSDRRRAGAGSSASRRRATRRPRPSSRRGTSVLSSVVSSQVDLHARYGGVVPEIASRAHVDLHRAGGRRRRSSRPGCRTDRSTARAARSTPSPPPTARASSGALLVGVSRGQGARARRGTCPFVAVNHLEAHLYAAFLEEPDLELPLVVLLVSGGHTLLVLDGGPRPLPGARLDDRRRRRRGVRQGRPLPRPRLPGRPGHRPARASRATPRRSASRGRCSATALRLLLLRAQDRGGQPRAQAPRRRHGRRGGVVPGGGGRRARHQGAGGRRARSGAKGLCLGGGVAANSRLRERFLDACVEDGLRGVPARAGPCAPTTRRWSPPPPGTAGRRRPVPARHRRPPQPAASPTRG